MSIQYGDFYVWAKILKLLANKGLVYAGTWNASTNTPVLQSGVGVDGNFYVVSVAGNTTLDGISSWAIGDWAIFNGTAWEKVSNASSYILPIASASVLGGIKIGSNISITADGTISVAPPYSLPISSNSVLGGVKIGSNINIAGDGTISVAAPYSLPIASNSVLGGIKVGTGLSIAGDGTLSSSGSGSNIVNANAYEVLTSNDNNSYALTGNSALLYGESIYIDSSVFMNGKIIFNSASPISFLSNGARYFIRESSGAWSATGVFHQQTGATNAFFSSVFFDRPSLTTGIDVNADIWAMDLITNGGSSNEIYPNATAVLTSNDQLPYSLNDIVPKLSDQQIQLVSNSLNDGVINFVTPGIISQLTDHTRYWIKEINGLWSAVGVFVQAATPSLQAEFLNIRFDQPGLPTSTDFYVDIWTIDKVLPPIATVLKQGGIRVPTNSTIAIDGVGNATLKVGAGLSTGVDGTLSVTSPALKTVVALQESDTAQIYANVITPQSFLLTPSIGSFAIAPNGLGAGGYLRIRFKGFASSNQSGVSINTHFRLGIGIGSAAPSAGYFLLQNNVTYFYEAECRAFAIRTSGTSYSIEGFLTYTIYNNTDGSYQATEQGNFAVIVDNSNQINLAIQGQFDVGVSGTSVSAYIGQIAVEYETNNTLVNMYALPPATTTQLGGLKVGSGLAITTDGTLSTTAGQTATVNPSTAAAYTAYDKKTYSIFGTNTPSLSNQNVLLYSNTFSNGAIQFNSSSSIALTDLNLYFIRESNGLWSGTGIFHQQAGIANAFFDSICFDRVNITQGVNYNIDIWPLTLTLPNEIAATNSTLGSVIVPSNSSINIDGSGNLTLKTASSLYTASNGTLAVNTNVNGYELMTDGDGKNYFIANNGATLTGQNVAVLFNDLHAGKVAWSLTTPIGELIDGQKYYIREANGAWTGLGTYHQPNGTTITHPNVDNITFDRLNVPLTSATIDIWAIQDNSAGYVTTSSAGTAVNTGIAIFDGTTGTLIKTSTITIASSLGLTFPSSGYIEFPVSPNNSTDLFLSKISGNTNYSFLINSNGVHKFSDGTNPYDISFERSAAGTLLFKNPNTNGAVTLDTNSGTLKVNQLIAGTTNTATINITVPSSSVTYTVPDMGANANFVLSTAGGSGLSWLVVTGTSQSISVNHGYIANNTSLVTLTLPTTANPGDVIEIVGLGAGGWKLAQNLGQSINFGNLVTTTGTGGYISSTNKSDTIRLVCTSANTTFSVTNAVGSLSVV